MAGELNFLADIELDQSSVDRMAKQMQAAIKKIEQEGTLMDQSVSKSMTNIASGASVASQGLAKGAESAKEVSKGLDEASENANKMKEALGEELSNQLSNLSSMAAKFGMAFGAAEFIKKVIDVRGEFQQLEIAFSTMLGSKARANALMKQLINTAAKTPFGMQDLANGSKMLLAFGTEANEVNDILVHLGDIAAGLSMPLNDLVYLYGTTMAQGQMFTQDLRQMQGRGIPIADEIAKILNVSKEAVPEMVSAGKVTAEVFSQAVMAMSSEGGQFYNLMNAQSESLTGQVSNLEDGFDQLLNTLGKSTEGILSGVLSGLSGVLDALQALAPYLLALVTSMGAYKAVIISINAYNKAYAVFQSLATAATKAQTNATKTQIFFTNVLARAQKALMANPYALAAAAIIAVASAIYFAVQASEDETDAVKEATKAHEEYKKQINKELDEADTFISTMQDKTKSIVDQKVAWENLQKTTEAFKGFTFEEVQAMSPEQIAQIKKDYENQQGKKFAEAEIARLKAKEKYAEANLYTYHRSGKTYNELMAKKAEKAREERLFWEDVLKEYDSGSEDKGSGSGTDSEKVIKNKSYWEKIKKNAEDALHALDASVAKDTQEWKTLVATINEANEKIKEYDISEKDKEKKIEEERKKIEEERKKIAQELAAFNKETSSDIEAIQSQMKLDALKRELKYTTDINKKLEIQKKINKELLDQKKKGFDNETENAIRRTIGEKQYAKYKESGVSGVDDTFKGAIEQIIKGATEEWTALSSQIELDNARTLLEMKTKAYQEYAEEVLKIEQEKADRIKEIDENEELTDTEKEERRTKVEDVAKIEKRLLAETSGIEGDIVANVQALMKEVMGYTYETLTANLETIFSDMDAKIAELQGQLSNGTEMTPEERAKKEELVNTLITKRNVLTKQASNLIKKEANEVKKTNKEVNNGKKPWSEVSKEISAYSDSIGAVGDTADMVLDEVGGALSGTAKDALQAVSGIASFAQGAFDLITQTAEITNTTSKSIMASNIIGWIMMAVQLLVKLGTFLAQYSAENQLKAEIESLGEEIELTEKKFENFEKKVKLRGSVGSKALKEEIMLAEDMNATIDLQNEKYEKTIRLLELQRQKYGEDSDKFRETQAELAELEGERYDTLQDQADRYQEIFEELATTDVTSFANDMASAMVDGFVEGLHGMESAYEDTVNNLIKEQLTKSLSLKLVEAMKPAFDRLEDFTKDGELTANEMDTFRNMLDNVKDANLDMANQYRQIMADYGLLDDAEMESESKGFEAMSQDTADELNGRFTALQMSGANIEQNTLLMTQQNQELLMYSRGIAEQATISTQIAQQQLYELREIKDNTAVLHSLDDRLRNIESYTSKL